MILDVFFHELIKYQKYSTIIHKLNRMKNHVFVSKFISGFYIYDCESTKRKYKSLVNDIDLKL
jgi:hypothetical protein